MTDLATAAYDEAVSLLGNKPSPEDLSVYLRADPRCLAVFLLPPEDQAHFGPFLRFLTEKGAPAAKGMMIAFIFEDLSIISFHFEGGSMSVHRSGPQPLDLIVRMAEAYTRGVKPAMASVNGQFTLEKLPDTPLAPLTGGPLQ